MMWARALAAWLLIIIAESASGALRRSFLAPAIGEIPARQVGVGIGSVLALAIAWLTIRWIGAATAGSQLAVGALWVVLTVAFEVGAGMALGYPGERILADFEIHEGGLMSFGLVFMLFAPALAARARGIGPTPGMR